MTSSQPKKQLSPSSADQHQCSPNLSDVISDEGTGSCNASVILSDAQIITNSQQNHPHPTNVLPHVSLKKNSTQVDDLVTPPKKKARMSHEQREATISSAVSTILQCLDDNPMREGLRKTPMRYAKALLSLTSGYTKSVEEVLGDAEFDESHSEMVLIRNIDVFSLCEHHLLPFYGQCHVAYIPRGTVIGLSKIARIVDLYAKRFQVQERLTTQIADAVSVATNASGVMVLITCSHMCMAMRGVQKVGSQTTTTVTRGRYAQEAELRREFLSITSTTDPHR